MRKSLTCDLKSLMFPAFLLAVVFNYTCYAPSKVGAPIEGYLLKSAVVLTRHGCRAPFDGYGKYKPQNWTCDADSAVSPRMSTSLAKNNRRYHTIIDSELIAYPPSCQKADLTTFGMNQHQILGSTYRQYLVENMSFLPDVFDPSMFFFRSSEPERCIRSAESFIHGLYPPINPDEYITITTGTDPLELLHPRPGHCKDLLKSWNKWIHSDEYIEKKANAELYLRSLVEETGLEWDDNQWLWIGDWLYTIGCCGSPLPDGISQEAFDVALDAVEFFTLKFFSQDRGVAGASILREIFRIFEKSMNGQWNVKFSLLSAHDVSIVSVLNTIGISISTIPPFASHLAFEIWSKNDQDFIRILLNGEDIGNGLMKYSHFKNMLSAFIHYCPELG